MKDQYVHRNITGQVIDIQASDIVTLRSRNISVTLRGSDEQIFLDGKPVEYECCDDGICLRIKR